MRKIDVAVISDTHLGIYGCQAKEILHYLNSIDPTILILNGDIIDIWNYNRFSFGKSHIAVIKQILTMVERGTTIYYITGNHDEAVRKISGIQLSNLHIVDHLVLDIGGKKTWIFHGDIFDATTKGWARMLAKLGGKGYDILIFLNRLINDILEKFGREKISMSKRIKNSIKSAVKWVDDFEKTAVQLAMDQDFDVVICGHIHMPTITKKMNGQKKVIYMNSGDWVENCTGLEFNDGQWTLFKSQKNEIDIVDQIRLSKEENLPNTRVAAFYTRFKDSEVHLNHVFGQHQVIT
jgi:UDP-2,3-diacylglucosamine pyrophosphatase LpxH